MFFIVSWPLCIVRITLSLAQAAITDCVGKGPKLSEAFGVFQGIALGMAFMLGVCTITRVRPCEAAEYHPYIRRIFMFGVFCPYEYLARRNLTY